MDNKRNIRIFDTTLRDGEQSPGASMDFKQKMEFAQALIDLGVDVIEAGFPIASPGDFESVREIASTFRGAEICGLARSNDQDIDRAWEALKHSDDPRIHVFLATSAIHREFKLNMTPDEIIDRAVDGVKRAKGYCDSIEFSPEDAARTEIDFLCRVVEAVIEAGATTVNIPDTVGYATPEHMGSVIKSLVNRVPNIDKAVISIHCHDDLGLAVANSLAAVQNGAGQIECTINGIGERAGNCSLEEVVMAMRTRGDFYQCDTRIDATKLVPTSRLLTRLTGMQIQRNKAIVGRNAFAHEAGIHQDGMLKERTTYEIMRPEDVGFSKTDLVLGKHSGRAALGDRANQLGYELDNDQLKQLFSDFKALADQRKEIYDDDIVTLIERQLHGSADEEWKLVEFSCNFDGQQTQFEVQLARSEEKSSAEQSSDSEPFEVAFSAICNATGLEMTCKSFELRNSGFDGDKQPVVDVEVEFESESYRGRGTADDSMTAALDAFIGVANRIQIRRKLAENAGS